MGCGRREELRSWRRRGWFIDCPVHRGLMGIASTRDLFEEDAVDDPLNDDEMKRMEKRNDKMGSEDERELAKSKDVVASNLVEAWPDANQKMYSPNKG